MSDTETADTTQADPEVERQARELGWAPQDNFKGDPEKWVDAKTFLDRGEQVLPIVKATNRRLREDLTKATGRLTEMESALQQSQETIAALQEYHETEIKDRVKRTREDLLEQLRQAKRDENVDREVEVTDALSRLNAAAERSPDKTSGPGKAPLDESHKVVDYTQHPDFVSWSEENSWFGEDVAKTQIAQGVAMTLRRSGDRATGRAFLDKVSEGTNKEIQRLTGRAAPSKVEGSRGGSSAGGGNGSGKSYHDLPSEAKAACDKFASDTRLVGPGRVHKDMKSFRDHYIKQFFRDI